MSASTTQGAAAAHDPATAHGRTEQPRGGIDLDDPTLSRFEVVREGARQDGVEIVHYEPPFPVPKTRGERRLVRIVTGFFLLTGLASTVFMLVYILWPFEYAPGADRSDWFTPLLGVSLGIALISAGFGVMTWGKKLLPHEIAIQERHEGGSAPKDRKIAATTLLYIGDEMGLRRRPILGLSLLAGLTPVAVAAGAPFIGALIKDPNKGHPLLTTAFREGIRLTHKDGSPIRPEEVSVGGQITVFPGVPGGATNRHADSPTLLIHLRGEDADALRANLDEINRGSMFGNFVAYSKICTHAGCPASLYEQQTNRLLCPCHQSQFLITDNAKPVFGPATRALPMLPITVNDEGFFVATSDYKVPIGPAFWERYS
ncbi:MAG TPA: Rieske 2Fe-2S domain-containing protein [Pilimelia sp.]|nr:Rieske 2Fe-2S domain-containing protein [Pilimelia sp.]